MQLIVHVVTLSRVMRLCFLISSSSRMDFWTSVSVSSLRTGAYSNFLGIMKAELLDSMKRCLSSRESIAESVLLSASTSCWMCRRRCSMPDTCIITARPRDWKEL